MKDSKSLTRSSVDSETLSITEQLKIPSVLRNPKLPVEEAEVAGEEVELLEAGTQITQQTGKPWTFHQLTHRLAPEVAGEVQLEAEEAKQ